MMILETDRLLLRELEAPRDAEFVLALLNTPKFIKYIGDRGVRSAGEAAAFIDDRYRLSYRLNGYGLYLVEQKPNGEPIGLCGFVRRDTLPGPDIGFAFLPQYEGLGFGYESASAILSYGRETLGFGQVLAITSLDNDASRGLLEKLGFAHAEQIDTPEGETLNLFSYDPPSPDSDNLAAE